MESNVIGGEEEWIMRTNKPKGETEDEIKP